MKRIKLIITAFLLIILFPAFFLLLGKLSSDKGSPVYNDLGKASASTVTTGEPANNSGSINSDDYTYIPPSSEYDDNDNINKEEVQMTETFTPATEMDLDPNSITVYVNKEYNLPKDFVPDDLRVVNIPFDIPSYSDRKLMRKEAAEAIEKLFDAASANGYTLYGISGYRSYSRQKEIFLNNLITKGKTHTLRYSAAPGTSEHQTGLAMDLSSESVDLELVTDFANCPEGKWLAEHAHEYGFIIRYPKDKEDITGYAYEPWHIRYVGKDLANYLYNNGLTLDEYYHYVPSEGFDYEKKYADLLNYKPTPTPTPKPKPTPTPTPVPEENPDDGIPSDDFMDEFKDKFKDKWPHDFFDDFEDDQPDNVDDYDDDNDEEGVPENHNTDRPGGKKKDKNDSDTAEGNDGKNAQSFPIPGPLPFPIP